MTFMVLHFFKPFFYFEPQSPYTVSSGRKLMVPLHQPPKYGTTGVNRSPWLAGIYDSFLDDILRHYLLYVHGCFVCMYICAHYIYAVTLGCIRSPGIGIR